MKKWIIIGVVLAFAALLMGMYNGMVQRDVQVSTSWAQVENVLQRRADLIPNLVNSVKGFAKHEKDILNNLANARAQYSGAKTVPEKIEASNRMESALARLMVIVENYPNLKANETFARLMDELSGTENRIAVERKRYNEAVQDFNTAVRRFPSNLIASVFGFKAKPFFEAAPEARTVPKVDFEK